MAASIFWLLNALNKNYSTQTTYPITFVYDQDELIPLKPLPEEVSINVTGKGWRLLRKTLRVEVQPAEIYIRSLPRNNFLLGSALRPALVTALDGLQLNFIVTDSVLFDFDEKVTRRIPLMLDPTQRLTDNQHTVVGPVRVLPDSITFTGPSSMVDSIMSPFLLRLPNTPLTAPTQTEVPIEYDFKTLVTSDVQEAVVSVNVQTLLQEERQVAPELVNLPAGRNVTLRPPFVLVRYQLLEDSAATINRSVFRAMLDFSKYNPQDSTLAPQLVQQPAGARNVTLWPDRVKVIMEE